ncbi:hypothetical protein C0971_05445 [Bacillus methanolicus]|uniref:hypothetical protein n=1 Tax=Bacillus methanolicus TaxID=1471 RepID=UPI0020102A95|nr:hypothetical protein [Bacillus methanolicus]UQD51526.1 hypothetical protein C0971_05445 [Bacillus methanolicus]
MLPVLFVNIFLLSGCMFGSDQLIANRHAEVLLTKRNELQFRFKINEHLFADHSTYKVRVSIHDKQLAAALGATQFVYGENEVINGEYIEANESNERVIYMDPIPLKKDFHVFEIENKIIQEKAVSIEVFNDERVLGQTYLTNFSSQL